MVDDTGKRNIALDTETTGLNVSGGDRIVEIGCVEFGVAGEELASFHHIINPGRSIPTEATEVHGIRDVDVKDKPRFADLAPDLIDFVRGANVVIHNASFDVNFLNSEFQLCGMSERMEHFCDIIDSLEIAGERFGTTTGKSLDNLCKVFRVDASRRDKHSALLDAQLLAQVFVRLTAQEDELFSSDDEANRRAKASQQQTKLPPRTNIVVIKPTEDELARHRTYMDGIES